MKIGSTPVSDLKLGAKTSNRAYYGANQVWDTRFVFTAQTTTASETFTIPCQAIGTFDALIDWGDGSTSTITAFNDADLAHTYASAGTHTIAISGSFTNIYFNNGGDAAKVRTVTQLGNVGWETANSAFYGCTGMTSFTAGSCNTSNVGNFGSLLRDCTAMTSCDVTKLDTSSAVNFAGMFWNCSSVTSLDVSNFDTSSVTAMNLMLRNLGSMTVSGLDGWDIEAVTNFTNFANSTTLPTATYDAILIAWDAQNPVDSLSAHFGGSTYTAGGAAATARANLISTDLWTITDGGTA